MKRTKAPAPVGAFCMSGQPVTVPAMTISIPEGHFLYAVEITREENATVYVTAANLFDAEDAASELVDNSDFMVSDEDTSGYVVDGKLPANARVWVGDDVYGGWVSAQDLILSEEA